MTIPFPKIPPAIFSAGPFALRWYALMYVAGYFTGYRLAARRIRRGIGPMTLGQLEALVSYLVIGMLVGARIFYVTVYDFPVYRADPWRVLAIWRGGLSFHGAVIGMALATGLFARRYRLNYLAVTDMIALGGTPGLFFGRIGNFINGELYGRPSSVPWAMIFPDDPLKLPRHPSQLYEAVAEGVLLSIVLWAFDRRARAGNWNRPGLVTGAFLAGYAIMRFLVEFTREPDAQLGFIIGSLSMGQILSAIMMVAGGILLYASYRGQRANNISRRVNKP